ncbi:Hypothetical predicted protein, partial [Paramuricea clavata]
MCASSIGCEKGVVNLYDSLFYDVILDDLQQQAENLVGDDFQEINVVPIQQQSSSGQSGTLDMCLMSLMIYKCKYGRVVFLQSKRVAEITRMKPLTLNFWLAQESVIMLFHNINDGYIRYFNILFLKQLKVSEFLMFSGREFHFWGPWNKICWITLAVFN